ncbi:hypothetical protein BAY61_18065 [Prauserella marina]|uniref:Uncharacterized protein n=1 Tax=Prauserella marina TaxID=530584 RepID=A0A222VRR5_9PSEU|nr:hypothetical protein BAY61_18065 [Prauserella marina]PWV73997.1 hypothetical protein DES30_108171 [Prauserella marina]SDD60578.1 hypothetical protein SAMN05421630_110172 [Prauserella marina]
MDAAESAFRLLCTGPAPLALDCAAIGHGLPRRRVTLIELRNLLLAKRTAKAARDAVWRQLVIAAQAHGAAWVLGAVGVGLPGLRRAAGKLMKDYTGDPDDIDSEVLAGFTARLKTIDPDAGSLAIRLMREAQIAGAKVRTAELDYATRTRPQWESFEPRQADRGHEDLVLAEAVRDGILTGEEASLILSTRLDDMRLHEVADQLGESYFRVFRARQRAESALISWLNARHTRKKAEICEQSQTPSAKNRPENPL